MKFIPRKEQVPSKWYVCNSDVPVDGVVTLGGKNGSSNWDFAVAGPFDTEREADQWKAHHPEHRKGTVHQKFQ